MVFCNNCGLSYHTEKCPNCKNTEDTKDLDTNTKTILKGGK